MQTITVYYKPVYLGGVNTGRYHEFLVYDKGDGSTPQYARGGPSLRTDGLSGDAPSGSSGQDSGKSSPDGIDPPFGYVKTEIGDYTPDTPDYALLGTYHGEMVKSSDDLSADWQNITSGMKQFGQQRLGYSPLGPNSNSDVNAGLQADGLPPPRGQTGAYPAPPYDRTPWDSLNPPLDPNAGIPWFPYPPGSGTPILGGGRPLAPHYEPHALNSTGDTTLTRSASSGIQFDSNSDGFGQTNDRKVADVTDNPLNQIPEFDRISLRAVLVTGDADPSDALKAAGIHDPVVLPVAVDDGSGSSDQSLTPGIQATLEFQATENMPSPEEAMMPDAVEPAAAAPRTAMLPPGPLGQALAPVRPRR